ncbi:MAG: adenylate/guanylate cyclase domain-containing protein [Hormoscilla sp. GM102CHS1]|nr:adenylate/guanylate cyclase domain-containing protein [Hormoscilla sp. GM102CHS1]
MQRRIATIPVPWIRDNFATGIGISAGEVVVGNIGSPQHLDYTAIGDEVNIASRLQSMAKGGQILCSQSVYHVTKDIFEFNKLGTVTVKGRKKSVETYEVLQLVRYLISTIIAFSKPVLKRICSNQHQSKFN